MGGIDSCSRRLASHSVCVPPAVSWRAPLLPVWEGACTDSGALALVLR